MYNAQRMKNAEKKNSKAENTAMIHKGSRELSKIAITITNVDKVKKTKNQALNITEA